MSRRTWFGLLAFGVLLLVLAQPTVRRVTSQTTSYSLTYLWNAVAPDGVVHFAPWAGAQSPNKSAEYLANAAFVPNPSGVGGYWNTTGSFAQADNLPATCTVGEPPIILTTDATFCVCEATDTWTCNEPGAGVGGDIPGANSVGPTQLVATGVTPGDYGTATQVAAVTLDADGRVETASNVAIAGLLPTLAEIPEEPCVAQHTFILEATHEQYTCVPELTYVLVRGDQGVPAAIPGLLTAPNPDGGILSQHWKITSLSGTQALGDGNGMVAVTVGTAGATLTLPDPTSPTAPTTITMYIVDEGTGNLTVLPFGTEAIGDHGNVAPPPITGKGSKYEFTLQPDGNWHLITTTTIPLGALGGQTMCVGTGGSVDSDAVNVNTDFNHTITCTIPPTLALKEGDVIQACTSYEMTTGAASPEITVGLKLGVVKIAETGDGQPGTNFSNRSMVVCWLIILAANPSAATPTYTAPIGIPTAIDTNGDANGVTQPVEIDFTVEETATFFTNLSIDATGINTVTQQAAWLVLFRK
jgi:hypothetical protein